MDNAEEVLMELNHFVTAKAPPETLPPVLEEYFVHVAKTGATVFPWTKIKPVFRAKLENVITEFSPTSEDVPAVPNVDQFSFGACKEKVFQQLDCFNGIPFTVQRLCELLIAPRKHYKRTDKFMRALEKNMLVVSTIEPVLSRPDFGETLEDMKPPKQLVVNGIDKIGDTSSSSSSSSRTDNDWSESKSSSEDKSAALADAAAASDDLQEDALGPCDSGKTQMSNNSSEEESEEAPSTIPSSTESVSSNQPAQLQQDDVSEQLTLQSDSQMTNLDLISGSDETTGEMKKKCALEVCGFRR